MQILLFFNFFIFLNAIHLPLFQTPLLSLKNFLVDDSKSEVESEFVKNIKYSRKSQNIKYSRKSHEKKKVASVDCHHEKAHNQAQQQTSPLLGGLFSKFNWKKSQKNIAADPPIVTSPSVHFCSGPHDAFKPKSVQLIPDPPVRGQSLTIIVNGTLVKPITVGAKAQVRVKLGFIQLLNKEYDICENAHEVGMTCPVEKGELGIVKQVDIPAEVPPGRYRIHVDASLADGSPASCIDADFRM